MTKRYIITAAVCLFMALTAGAQTKELLILHSNDTHSCIDPLSVNVKEKGDVAGKGGFMRRIEMLRQERLAHPDLLYFDSGDFCQGSPFYTIYQGDVEIKLMNEMGIDASTIGNHEFDFGVENMVRLFRMANFPIVCSNYDFGNTELKSIVKPYLILKRNGLKIGVFPLCPKMEGLVDEDKCQGLTYLDPIAKANEMTQLLKKKKCDLVICISHLGWDKHNGANDQEMVAGSHGIDLVLGGHSHTFFEELRYVKDLDGRNVPIDQNGKHGAYIGKMVLKFDKNASH